MSQSGRGPGPSPIRLVMTPPALHQLSGSSPNVQRPVSVTPRRQLSLLAVSGRAAAHPTLVTSLASPAANHVASRKRRRPHELPQPNETVKRRILDASLIQLASLRSRYADSAAELLFLQSAGSFMDFPTWTSRRGVQQQLNTFLASNRLDPLDPEEDLTALLTPACTVPETPDPPPEIKPEKAAPGRANSIGDSVMSSQELIVERAKQEAYVVQRISELQREGLWSEKRLPKVQEPPRNKAHWDYLLEEMLWMSQDFVQERKWKKANAKKCAKMVQKYFSDKEMQQKKEEKVQELQLRKLANVMAKEVKQFWAGVNKIVEFKQATRLEEKRKKALDQHLSFIVDQTEKYSTWLAESMNKPQQPLSDEEFQPMLTSSDDEETIAKEEEEGEDKENNAQDEVERLRRESEMPLEDLLNDLPEDYLRDRDKPAEDVDMESEDFTVDSAHETSDDEETLAEQEAAEGSQNHAAELAQLEADSQLTVEQLRAKYAGALTPPLDSDDDETGSESDETEVSESEEEEPDIEEDVSLKVLVDTKGGEQANKEIDDATAIAESLQPKGNTLQTTSVVTPVPFLLRHELREYQHIGLDWLVTMYERKLNGILADEMGLGKTIQTIALLAHLACEKGNWGPHLIVVPTSVMLNWEMEFKKWCPGFKILTYYGTIKERKAKRSGWTKPNAFHVCIVSYKLVIQDHQSFRRKKWQYLVLDEAQNIKNFRSQRWQLLLNFATQRRLLLTGTPLQNNLMELWSLMHFLMPHVFQSHREFKEWFSNPVTGMLEGNSEYNESIIKRLHKVLRPFLLRRLKTEVEKQLPKKYEHVVMCRLSKRQRFLYEDFMSRAKTKETLASGNLLSVMNVLMQLRKVCNHPNLFEVRPIISPFQMEPLVYTAPSLATSALDYDPAKHVDLNFLNLLLVEYEEMTAYASYRTRRTCVSRRMIEELPEGYVEPEPIPRFPFPIDVHNIETKMALPTSPGPAANPLLAAIPPVRVGTSPLVRLSNHPGAPLRITGSHVHLMKPPGHVKASGLPVQLVQTSTGRHIYFPLPSNSVIANGQRPGTLKSPTTPQVTESVTTSMMLAVTPMSVPVTSPVLATPSVPPVRPLVPPMEGVERRLRERRRARLRWMADVNLRRCARYPLFGADLVQTLRVVDTLPPPPPAPPSWLWSGHVHCRAAARPSICPSQLWTMSHALAQAVSTPQALLQRLTDVLSRFIVYVPAATAPCPTLHASHPPPSKLWRERRRQTELRLQLSGPCELLHPIVQAMATQFPDPRLIQYDCGKLQVLDQLLRRLKSERHKVLLFTQMTRMLDVLEAFLNCHGYIYLRLDGTTKVDQRQVLMERFNGDPRIFVFILSTRSGGVGVNLTGADTVVFYDSDWNPTMDAQAQDRCHRIGQTRDVHIYRLISEMTVEENILKKANQKRLLGDVAIEGGNFTTAYFKNQSTIQDLFNVDTNEVDVSKRLGREKIRTEHNEGLDKVAQSALESALASAEDAPDVEAARTATAEAAAELAEFDENIPLEEAPEQSHMSKAELELMQLVQQLKPIEIYAMRFVEENEAAWSAEQLAAAEKQIEEQKKEWELNRQAALQVAQPHPTEEEEEEQEVLTYGREDPTNQVWLCSRTVESLAMWCPPTPPQDEDDVYIDTNLAHLYQGVPLQDSQLPPVYVKKELKRPRAPELNNSQDGRRSIKMSRRDDSPITAPRSLFDHPATSLHKIRREVRMQHKYRGLVRPSPAPLSTAAAVRDENVPEWTVQEDEKLLQAIEELVGLPMTLMVVHAAQTPNWDLAADCVNSVSTTIRSPVQCRHRFESVVMPREEGKPLFDTKKQKKKLGGGGSVLRTRQLADQDRNAAWTALHVARYDALEAAVRGRRATPKPLLVNPLLKNPKHAAVLAESGIQYDTPLTPEDIALRRADRIAKDKKIQVTAQVTPEQLVVAQQRQLVAAASSSKPTPAPSPLPAQPPPAPTGVSVAASTAVASIVVAAASPLNSVMQTTGITTLSPALRQPRPLAIQEVKPPTVVSVANLTSAQLQARIAHGSLVSLPATAVKAAAAASSQQANYYRQQALLRQRMAGQPQVKLVQGQPRPVQPVHTKAQYVKQTPTVATAGVGVVKARTEDMAALVKQQLQRQQQQKAQQTMTTQLLTSAGVQLQGQAIPQAKAGVAGAQIRQLANYQQLLGKQGRVIVQAPGKLPAISMQHIHHVIKNAQPQHVTVNSQAVVQVKAAGRGTAPAPRQTIQVVPGTIRNSNIITQVANLSGIARQAGNPLRIQTATATALQPGVVDGAGNAIKMMTMTVQPPASAPGPAPGPAPDHTQS